MVKDALLVCCNYLFFKIIYCKTCIFVSNLRFLCFKDRLTSIRITKMFTKNIYKSEISRMLVVFTWTVTLYNSSSRTHHHNDQQRVLF